MLSTDESAICDYLKQFPETFVSAAEIARKVGGRVRYKQEPRWAHPILARLAARGIIETDSLGHYRLKPEPKKSKDRLKHKYRYGHKEVELDDDKPFADMYKELKKPGDAPGA